MTEALTELTGDVVFAEGPRWHDDRLWFSDMHGEAVYSVGLGGDRRCELTLPGRRPSGLGFLSDGAMLVVSILERQVLRWDGASLSVHADLSDLEALGCNDMIVTDRGVAYVGAFPEPGRPEAAVYRVDPDGRTAVAASDVVFPNGMVMTPAGSLIVAESMGRRFAEFDVAADGTLHDRRIFADCPGFGPDGICLDAAGSIWAAMPIGRQFQRIAPGGEVQATIPMGDRLAIACALGGPERKHLFLLSALEHAAAKLAGTRNSRIDVIEVDVAGAGQQ